MSAKTFNTGDVLTADDMNRIAADTDWQAVPLASGYTGTPQIRRIGDIVCVRGSIVRTAGNFPTGNISDIFTIPAQFRGGFGRYAVALYGGINANISVYADGKTLTAVNTAVGTANTIYLDNLTWMI